MSVIPTTIKRRTAMSINYTDRIPNNVGLSDKPAAATGAGVVAAQLYEVVARDGAGRLYGL